MTIYCANCGTDGVQERLDDTWCCGDLCHTDDQWVPVTCDICMRCPDHCHHYDPDQCAFTGAVVWPHLREDEDV